MFSGMFSIASHYFAWHYSRSIPDYMRIWSNMIWFFWHFFSIPLLAKTFFTPFQRIQDAPVRGFDPQALFESIVVNLLMRFVGMMVRFFVLAIGFALLFFALVFGALFFIVWLLAPLFWLFLILSGLILLIAP